MGSSLSCLGSQPLCLDRHLPHGYPSCDPRGTAGGPRRKLNPPRGEPCPWKQEKPRPAGDLGFSLYHQSLHFPSARAATRLRRPSARDSKQSRLECKPPTMGSAGVPPLVSSKQDEPSSRFQQFPDLLQVSLVPFRSLTLVVDRDLTQPGRMRQSLIPITLRFLL